MARQPMSVSGFCNVPMSNTDSHGRCKHIFLFSMGVWKQWVCKCKCHGRTTAKNEKRNKEE